MFIKVFLLVSLGAYALPAVAQTCPTSVSDDSSFALGGLQGETTWDLGAIAGDYSFSYGPRYVDGYSASGYTKCDCSSVNARYFSADTESLAGSFVGSGTTGGVAWCSYSLEWDISGPAQVLGGCGGSGGACSSSGRVEFTPSTTYDTSFTYWTLNP